MKVLFVTEASAQIGGGHVMRCLALATELACRGADVRFAVNEVAPLYVPSIARSRFPVETIATFGAAEAIAEHEGGVEAIICDSYSCDAEIERRFRPVARTIVVLDDLADRPHDCDLLIDTTYGRRREDYDGLTPPDAQILVGAGYALLRPEFLALREESLRRRAIGGGIKRILVSLGLTDVGGVTARVVAALSRLDLDAHINIVISPNASSRQDLERLAAKDARLMLHIDPPEIARLMAEADLAVGAGGTTSWERCCMGLPTVLLVLADNQRLVAQKLAEAGAALVAQGNADAVLEEMTAKVAALAGDRGLLSRISANAAKTVDGEGARRAASAILTPYRMRAATIDDAKFFSNGVMIRSPAPRVTTVSLCVDSRPDLTRGPRNFR